MKGGYRNTLLSKQRSELYRGQQEETDNFGVCSMGMHVQASDFLFIYFYQHWAHLCHSLSRLVGPGHKLLAGTH